MMIRYYLEIFAGPDEQKRPLLLDALTSELRMLGMHRTIEIAVTDTPQDGEPNLGVYFGSRPLAADTVTTEKVRGALAAGRAVIPVVDDLTEYGACVPYCLRLVNGFRWAAGEPVGRLVGAVLEGLGIAERHRRVFISHKREDGLAVAEQLHEELSRHGFSPFIDRFHIGAGRDVQEEIANQLEDCALLLLLETPLAHTSDWVFDEVDYTLSHHLGMHIVTWPGVTEHVPGTKGLARQRLTAVDVSQHRGFDTLAPDVMEQVIVNVEMEHARALIRRRRYLLASLADAARDAGLDCVPMPGWRTMVTGPDRKSIVQVTPRLPTVDDLYELDTIRSEFPEGPPGVLIHAPRHLPDARRDVLVWAGASRDLTLVPENAIGGYWRRSNVR